MAQRPTYYFYDQEVIAGLTIPVKVSLFTSGSDKNRNLGKIYKNLHQQTPLQNQESFSSPSFRNASLRDSSVAPRPENCTVMPCEGNMVAGFRLNCGETERCAGFWVETGPW